MRLYGSLCAMTVAVLSWLPAEPAQGQSLQRLFSTPAMRAELDRRRTRLNQGQPAVEEVVETLPLPVEPVLEEEVFYQLDGVVSRSDGYYTVWVNNQPYPHTQLPDNMELLAPFARGRLRIRNPETGADYEIVPGQILNLTTGEIQESYLRSAEVVESTETEATNNSASDPAGETDTSTTADQAQGVSQ